MQIIIKPLGAVAIFLSITGMAFLAIRPHLVGNARNGNQATELLSAPPVSQGSPTSVRIYDDAMQNGWLAPGFSWSKDVNYDCRTVTHTGTSSIRAHFNKFEGVKFSGPSAIDTKKFDRISFWLRAGNNPVQQLMFKAAVSGKEWPKHIEISSLPANQWVVITVPLTAFELQEGQKINEFWFQDGSGKDQSPFFIDDIQLLGGSTPNPIGSSVPLSAHQ